MNDGLDPVRFGHVAALSVGTASAAPSLRGRRLPSLTARIMNLRATEERYVDGLSPPRSDDLGLLGRLQQRDPEAQAYLLRSEGASLRGTAMSILGSEGD